MKIIRNERLIKRNARIGSWTSLGALGVLGAGMYLSFTRPELFAYSLLALLLGFTLTQVGMYMGNKFGRSPRPDEKLDAGLKGLSNDFAIYHYVTPVSHLLIGPAGLWVLMPYHQRGQVAYQKKRWRVSGGGFVQSYMRVFGQEGIGRPDIEIDNEIKSLRTYLAKHMDGAELPAVNALMVFTSDEVDIEGEGAPIPALKLKQLKDFIRQRAKEVKLPAEALNPLRAALE